MSRDATLDRIVTLVREKQELESSNADLLAALEKIAERIVSSDINHTGWNWVLHLQNIARAAIGKARLK